MADSGGKWEAIPDKQKMHIETRFGSIRRIDGLSQHMVSGKLAAAAASAGVDPTGVGALALASGDAYSVRLARDRMLIVGGDDGIFEPGWSDAGYAVTDMSALAVFEIDGMLADEIISRATVLPVSGPSAAVSFAGIKAYLYRHRTGEAVRVHVDATLVSYLWAWFETVLPMLPSLAPGGLAHADDELRGREHE